MDNACTFVQLSTLWTVQAWLFKLLVQFIDIIRKAFKFNYFTKYKMLAWVDIRLTYHCGQVDGQSTGTVV